MAIHGLSELSEAIIVTEDKIKELRYGAAWAEPRSLDEVDDNFTLINLIDDSKTDILTMISKGISKQIQFPVNTVFLHGLGVIASAMTKSFSYSIRNNKAPVNLYIITSQPPSSGKSGVNGFFCDPVRIAFADFNKRQKIKQGALQKQKKAVSKELKDSSNDMEVDALLTQMSGIDDKLIDTPTYRYAVTNTTPEALESLAFNQKGAFNVISDEAGAINVLIGGAYNDSSKPSNEDIVLQGWDGDYLSVNRVGRDSGEGFVKGSIVVIAQDATVTTLLKSGLEGTGLSERFLLLREQNMLGKRDHREWFPVPEDLKARYSTLINQLVFSDDTTFTVSESASKLILDNKMKIEPHMGDDGKYSNSLLRGVVGKMDKQVMKMASVLHVSEHWVDGAKPTKINDKTIKWAIKLYKELIKLYIDAANSDGFIGEQAEIKELKEQFTRFLDKKKQVVTFTEIRDYVKGKPVFRGRHRLSKYIKENLIIKCIELNLCTLVGSKVVINPNLK